MVTSGVTHTCSDCGTSLGDDPEVEGLCPGCLMRLALDAPTLFDELRSSSESPTLRYTATDLAEGKTLGNRYRVRSLLGRGGMGEVWRAFDLKLRVDLALKALRQELLQDKRALEALRQEVRTAREVISPNVCRVFDLVELDGQELVSMEYIDGITLAEILKMRSPLELTEAREIGSQFLAGLEAIHDAGLVHRDVKPENIMMTRSGRVVMMDFGIAKGLADRRAGTVSGTPAYMAPEQARGESVNPRADVFSAGVVLSEMIAPGGIDSHEAREAIWKGIHHEPPELPDSAWAPVLRRSVARIAEQRFASAAALSRALEEITLRVEGAEDVQPYPGLASFTESDAEYFFGRELEVEEMWKKLRRPHLLGLVGPSGAGKSSFLRAGLLPVIPIGWRAVVANPGSQPFMGLARVLAKELAGDEEAVQDLLQFDDPGVAVSLVTRWRQCHDQALIVIDQFEELFTLNPLKTQERFAELLGRLALESDAHVLLSMRDDFLFYCHSFKPLHPILSELTMLGPPTGAALRRAVVQPALKCGYRFEDDSLVEAMVGEVGNERGALPMLAFAAARLWDTRDRDRGLLTREAYEHIGGVGGALAQHAEATLEKIGQEHTPIVRELFRNLVTAQGTRAARDREELLSIFAVKGGQAPFFGGDDDTAFPSGKKVPVPLFSAERVLNTLIDARLLTSYEVPATDDDAEPQSRIEIIHESLLSNWPRLVRWQTQDADSAQLRDQVRQAAQMWEERGRPEDLLWTGTSFGEYRLWRERYEGGLSTPEEDFGKAMVHRAERRKRRRRMAIAAAFIALLSVLAIVGGFWRRSVTEARRAEAANLFSLAQLQLEDYPTIAIAYSIASLELADSHEMRRLALEALWRGPTGFLVPTPCPHGLDFSPDGRWLATADPDSGGRLWPADGGPPTVLEGAAREIRISPRGDLVAATMDGARRELGIWTVPEGRFLRSFALGDQGMTFHFQFSRDGERLFTSTETAGANGHELEIRSWPVAGGEPDLLARIEGRIENANSFFGVDPTESRLSWPDGRRVQIARLEDMSVDMAAITSVDHGRTIATQIYDEQGRHLATSDKSGTLQIWSLERDPPVLTRTLNGGVFGTSAGVLRFDPSGSRLASGAGLLWDLTAPPDAEPLQAVGGYGRAFTPDGKWLATGWHSSFQLYPLARPYPHVLREHEDTVHGVAFTPDGKRLVSASEDGSVRLWPLGGSSAERSRVLDQSEGVFEFPINLAMAPGGSLVATGNPMGEVRVLPLDGSPVRELVGFTDLITAVAVGPQARLVAAGAGAYMPGEAIVRVWDLVTGEMRILDVNDGEAIGYLRFTGADSLFVHSGHQLRRWDLEGNAPRIVAETDLSSTEQADLQIQDLSPDSDQVLFLQQGRLWINDLETEASRELSSRGEDVSAATFDPTGTIIVSSDAQGIRVGSTRGGEPHLLVARQHFAASLAVSPDGRWIASGGANDWTIRLWPMPNLDKLPLHTLRRDELLAKLRSLTNLRVVRDPDSPSGWKLDFGPFPGWQKVPTW